MKPELLSFPHVSSYSALLLAGYIWAYVWARRRAKDAGVDPVHVDNLGLVLLVAGIFGARWFSRYFEIPGMTFWGAWLVWKGGGLVFYGSLLCGVGVGMGYAIWKRLSILGMADIVAPPIALGLAVGRIGCFLAGCCWGDICSAPERLESANPVERLQVQTFPKLCGPGFPLAVSFPGGSLVYEQHFAIGVLPAGATRSLLVHPTQLYEAAAAFVLALVLHLRFRSAHASGNVFLAFGLGYGAIRFAVEFLRADTRPDYWNMTLSQVISLVLIAVCAAIAVYRRRGQAPVPLSISPRAA